MDDKCGMKTATHPADGIPPIKQWQLTKHYAFHWLTDGIQNPILQHSSNLPTLHRVAAARFEVRLRIQVTILSASCAAYS